MQRNLKWKSLDFYKAIEKTCLKFAAENVYIGQKYNFEHK